MKSDAPLERTNAMANTPIINDIVEACARDLFAFHGAQLTRSNRLSGPHSHVAVIGFHGASMRGALGLGLDPGVVELLLGGTRDETTSPDGAAEDCIAEVANQLLGRIKNRLLEYGLALQIALPMVLRGVEVVLADSSSVLQFGFSSDAGELSIWFDARIDPGFVLQRRPDNDDAIGALEGAVTMF